MSEFKFEMMIADARLDTERVLEILEDVARQYATERGVLLESFAAMLLDVDNRLEALSKSFSTFTHDYLHAIAAETSPTQAPTSTRSEEGTEAKETGGITAVPKGDLS